MTKPIEFDPPLTPEELNFWEKVYHTYVRGNYYARTASEFAADAIVERRKLDKIEPTPKPFSESTLQSIIDNCNEYITYLRARVADLEATRSSLDCRYAGNYTDIDGSHCSISKPCSRCVLTSEAECAEGNWESCLQLLEAERVKCKNLEDELAEVRPVLSAVTDLLKSSPLMGREPWGPGSISVWWIIHDYVNAQSAKKKV